MITPVDINFTDINYEPYPNVINPYPTYRNLIFWDMNDPSDNLSPSHHGISKFLRH